MSMKKIVTASALCLATGLLFAQKTKSKTAAVSPFDQLKTQAIQDIDAGYGAYKNVALQIWNYAEVGYKETKSSTLLQQTLKDAGFAVQAGVAEIPTAFVATYGSGKPVIGILAEYDALPGLAQNAVPEKSGIAGKDAGHGCGHNLFGTAYGDLFFERVFVPF